MIEPWIVLSARAEADLVGIEDYIAAQDGPVRAAQAMSGIAATLRNLAHMPLMGRSRQDYGTRDALFFPSPPWIVMYRPLRDLSGIRVVRIVDGHRDLERLFHRRITR